MKPAKNNEQLFSLLQTLGYLLKISNYEWKTKSMKHSQKKEINQMIAFIKSEVRKLKRV